MALLFARMTPPIPIAQIAVSVLVYGLLFGILSLYFNVVKREEMESLKNVILRRTRRVYS